MIETGVVITAIKFLNVTFDVPLTAASTCDWSSAWLVC